MAVADVFDALISKRIYKPPFQIEKATAAIVAGRGAQFDPDIVDAFLARQQQFLTIAARYANNEEAISNHTS